MKVLQQQAVLLDSDTLGRDLSLQTLFALLPQLRVHNATAAHETTARLQGAEIAISNKVFIGREQLLSNPQLKLIVVAATGTNNVDLQAAAEAGVTVCNAQNYSTESVAQQALTLLLMMATQSWRYVNDVRQGRWSAQTQFCLLDYPIVTVNGMTLGIVGAGNSGRRFGELAAALGMRVRFAQLPQRPSHPDKTTLASLLPECDVLSLHCPLTTDTYQLVNADLLTRLKPGAMLLNVARGGLVDEHAVVAALRSGHLRAAAVDVTSVEPPAANHPFIDHPPPNLLVTPHIAWASIGARQQLLQQMIENIVAFVAGTPIRVVRPS